MDPEQHVPLSEEELAEHERRVQQSSSVKPITLRWLEYTTLVGEVRRRKQWHANSTHQQVELVKRMLALEAELARLRELLRKHGRHSPGTCYDPQVGWFGPCRCGWGAIERELAGEGKEA